MRFIFLLLILFFFFPFFSLFFPFFFLNLNALFNIKTMVKARKLIVHLLRALWIFAFIYNEYFIFIKHAHHLSIQLNVCYRHFFCG